MTPWYLLGGTFTVALFSSFGSGAAQVTSVALLLVGAIVVVSAILWVMALALEQGFLWFIGLFVLPFVSLVVMSRAQNFRPLGLHVVGVVMVAVAVAVAPHGAGRH